VGVTFDVSGTLPSVSDTNGIEARMPLDHNPNGQRETPMNAETFDITLSELKRRTPFRPFTVSLVNGHRFEVDFPDALVVRGGKAAYIGPGKVLSIFDHEGVAQITDDLLHSEESR
jgi:hypothetical protein